SNGVIGIISRDQPNVTTMPDVISPSIKGELYYTISKASYIQITWRNPTFLESGKYFCGAHVKISDKRSDRLNRMLTITVERPTIDDLFKSVFDLKKIADEQKQSLHDNEETLKSIKKDFNEQVEKQNQSLNDNEQTLKRLEEDLISNQQNTSTFQEEMKKRMAELSNSQTEWKGKIDKALDNQHLKTSNTIALLWQSLQEQENKISELQMESKAYKQHRNISTRTNPIFLATTRYNGSLYLLSNAGLTNKPVFAQAICELLRGYLVEVNTESEFFFLRNFLLTIRSPLYFIYTGGTDEGHEGIWINRYSKTSMKKFWSPKQPDNLGGGQNCQTFWKKYDWYMDDSWCAHTPVSELGFMCEIPE
ncbi:C-type lectin-related protein 1 precursor, partial [Biomphalaria pfeifferi]